MIISKVEQAKVFTDQGLSNSKIGEALELDRQAVPFLIDLYDEMKKVPIVVKDLVCVKKRLLMMRSVKLQHRIADFRIAHKVRLEELKKRKVKLIEMGYDLKHFDDLNDEIRIQQQTIVRTFNQFEQVEAELFEHKKYYKWNLGIAFLYGGAMVSVVFWALTQFVV